MNYLLHGADTYRSRKKLNEIIAAYKEKAGAALNFHRLDGEDDNGAALSSLLGARSLFAGKRLVVAERVLGAEKMFSSLSRGLQQTQGARDTLVILWEAELEAEAKKRLAEIEALLDKRQAFDPLQGAALERWIREEAAARGLTLSPVETTALARASSGDLWAIHNELEKRVLAQGSGAAVGRAAEARIFDLGDAFFSAPPQALRHLAALLHGREEPYGIFAYLANHIRTLLLVKSHAESGRLIPASFKIHPYVIKKASAAVRGLGIEDLRQRLFSFFEEDLRVKTGINRPEDSLVRLVIRAIIARTSR